MVIQAWEPLIYSSSPAVSRARERLEFIDRAVDWSRFDKFFRWLESAPDGEPAHRPLTVFKALLLEQWFALNAVEFDFDMADRICYRRFIGLADGVAAPSHAAVCAFRRLLTEREIADLLVTELIDQFKTLGLQLQNRAPGLTGPAFAATAEFQFVINDRPREWIEMEGLFLDYWHLHCGDRDLPLLSDIKLDDVPEALKPYLVLARVLPDGGFLHEWIGEQLEADNEGPIVGCTIDERQQKNLNAYGHPGLYGELAGLYRDVVSHRRPVGTSTYYYNARHNKSQLWIMLAPLRDPAGKICMLLGCALILPVSVN